MASRFLLRFRAVSLLCSARHALTSRHERRDIAHHLPGARTGFAAAAREIIRALRDSCETRAPSAVVYWAPTAPDGAEAYMLSRPAIALASRQFTHDAIETDIA